MALSVGSSSSVITLSTVAWQRSANSRRKHWCVRRYWCVGSSQVLSRFIGPGSECNSVGVKVVLVCALQYAEFGGEIGVDQGGLYRDMYSAFWMELDRQQTEPRLEATPSVPVEDKGPLFLPLCVGEPQAALLPNPRRSSPEDLEKYKQFGRLLLRLLIEFEGGQPVRGPTK